MFDYNPEHRNLVAGTDEMPFLFNISRGQRKGTLIFHIKICIHFYELRLVRVFQTSCSFKCIDKSCKAKSTMELLGTDFNSLLMLNLLFSVNTNSNIFQKVSTNK